MALQRLLFSERFIAVAIALNALVLAALSFKELEPWFAIIEAADFFFTVLFGVEIYFKVRQYGLQRYLKSEWNLLDLVVVVLSLPSLLLYFIPNSPYLGFLLLLRVFRVFKFFRFLKFIPNINSLLSGIRRALKASVFVILAFFIYTFVVSLFSCHIFHDIAPRYFRNPLVSFYTIFKIFTIEGWYEIPDTIAASVSVKVAFFTRAYFVLVVTTGGLFGLSLVNAIFVDEMTSDNTRLVERRVNELHQKIDAFMEQQNRLLSTKEAPDKNTENKTEN